MDKFTLRALGHFFRECSLEEILEATLGKVAPKIGERYRLLSQELFKFAIQAPPECSDAVKSCVKAQSLSQEDFKARVFETLKVFCGQTLAQLAFLTQEKDNLLEILKNVKQESLEMLVDAAIDEISEDVWFNVANMGALISFGFEEEVAKEFVAFVGPIAPEIITSYLDDLSSRIDQFKNDKSDGCDECDGCDGCD